MKFTKLLGKELKVIAIGVDSFEESMKLQEVQSVGLDWRPPAGGDPKLMDILRRLQS